MSDEREAAINTTTIIEEEPIVSSQSHWLISYLELSIFVQEILVFEGRQVIDFNMPAGTWMVRNLVNRGYA